MSGASWTLSADPGAWSVVNDDRGCSAYEVVRDGEVIVAFVVAHGADPFADAPPTRANARLIAAAPALLAALQMAVRRNDHDMLMAADELCEARAAIAKATQS